MTQHNPFVVNGILQRFQFDSPAALTTAHASLTQALLLSMQHPQAYNAPVDQALPAEVDVDGMAAYVHPYNVAAALLAVSRAGPSVGLELTVDPSLQVYQFDPAGWVQLQALSPHIQIAPVQVTLPAPPVPPAPPAPEVPPAPPAPPVPPAPPAPAPAPAAPAVADLSALVDAALGSTAPLGGLDTTPPPTPPAREQLQAEFPEGVKTVADLEKYRALMAGKPEAPAKDVIEGEATRVAPAAPAPAPVATTAEGVPGPAVVTLEQAKQEAARPATTATPAAPLPDPNVLASRIGPTGREQSSPFARKVEMRKKLADAPWWWEFFRYSGPRLFVESPAAALDPSSSGAGPVQAYAALVALIEEVLAPADPELTVAELRTFLREVATGIDGTESAAAIWQLQRALFAAKTSE
jgi:hypothetical protein